ncbi:MAG: hypothetical protein KGJ80_09600 [Chloroflexota bacterium]|nr:hypothetical protein [Chloroflexota bacterium]
MQFYDLGAVPWQETHALARALAQAGREGALVALPKPSYLCVGEGVDLDHEIDSTFCRAQGIPVFQREARHRAICFAQSQLELQVVLKQDHRLLAQGGTANYRAVLSPIFDVCQDLQLQPEYRPPNEILVRGRQIAAACIGAIDQSTIIAASLALEFDAKMFARLVDTQDDDLRARLSALVCARRTALHTELGWIPPTFALVRTLRGYLQHIVGGLRPGVIDPELRVQMGRAAVSRAPGHARRDNGAAGWSIYIGAGAEVRASAFKAPGGFLRALCEWQDDRIVRARLGGEFFCYPSGGLLRLEEALIGVSGDQVGARVDAVYRVLGLVTPGVQPAHWAKVLTPPAA